MKYIFSLFLVLLSCSTKDTKSVVLPTVSAENDTAVNQSTSKPTNLRKVTVQSEQKDLKSKIEQKYGKQLDFCSCIQFHDSLNNAAQKDLSDQQIEKLLNRWDEMETQCKELLNTNHRTPEERKSHEQKVRKCLNKK